MHTRRDMNELQGSLEFLCTRVPLHFHVYFPLTPNLLTSMCRPLACVCKKPCNFVVITSSPGYHLSTLGIGNFRSEPRKFNYAQSSPGVHMESFAEFTAAVTYKMCKLCIPTSSPVTAQQAPDNILTSLQMLVLLKLALRWRSSEDRLWRRNSDSQGDDTIFSG